MEAANDTREPIKATALNLRVLADLSKHARRFPNRISAVDAPHMRRCVKAGLVSICGAELELTDAGVEAIRGVNGFGRSC